MLIGKYILYPKKFAALVQVGYIFGGHMPLFLIKSVKKKKKDYMLNEENILKMAGKGEENYWQFNDFEFF